MDSYLDVLRVFSKLANSYDTKQEDTTVAKYSDKAAESQEDKSGITVALEDFSEKIPNSFHGYNSTNITAKDAKKKFFARKSDNIYEQKEMQSYLKEKGNLFQNDIYKQEIANQGGIKYCQDDDDYIQSALSLAKADIDAIETAYTKAKFEAGAKKDGNLSFGEINSYDNLEMDFGIKYMDLDGDEKTISAEEYASYILLADGLAQYDYNTDKTYLHPNRIDGLLTKQEAQDFLNATDYANQKAAQEIYNQYFNEDK